MKASSVIGIVIGMVTIALGATMEGAPRWRSSTRRRC